MQSYLKLYVGEYTGPYFWTEGGAVAVASLIWEALVADTDDDYDMLLEDTGAGSASVARTDSTTTGLMLDSDGVYRDVPTDTAVWQDARLGRNWFPYSEDFTQANWVKTNASVVSSNNTAPDGTSTATHISASAAAWFVWDFMVPATNPGETAVTSMWVKSQTGADQKFIIYTDGQPSPELTATSTWQRFSDAQQAAGTGYCGIGHSSSQAAELLIWGAQMETDYAGSWPVTNSKPSGYIPTNGAEANGYFGDTEGMTVTSNIVTGPGSALSPTPALHIDPPLTNKMLYSNDLTNTTAWSIDSNVTETFDQVGLTGAANTASLAIKTSTGSAYIGQSVGLSVASLETHVWRLFIKKDATATGHFPYLDMQVKAGNNHSISFDLTDGSTSTVLATAGGCRHEVVDHGTYFEVLLEHYDDTASDNSWSHAIYPAFSTTLGGAQDTAIAGGLGLTILNSEVYGNNATIEQVKGTAPIFTTTASVSSDNQVTTFSGSNLDETSDFGISFEYEGNVGDGTKLLIHSNTTGGSQTFTDSSSIGATVENTYPGSTTQHSDTVAPVFGDTSIYFDGTNDWLFTTSTPSNYHFGATGAAGNAYPFSISFWWRPVDATPLANTTIFGVGGGTVSWSFLDGNEVLLANDTDGSIRLAWNSGGAKAEQSTGAGVLSDNTWHFIEISNDPSAGKLNIYVDGVSEYSGTNITNLRGVDTLARLSIGATPYSAPANEINGYIDEFRVAIGTAGNTGETYDVPIAPWVDPEPLVKNPIISTQDTDTVLLVHSDTFDGDTDFDDSSYIEDAMQTVGSPRHTTDASKFGATSIELADTECVGTNTANAGKINFQDSYTVEFWLNHTMSAVRYIAAADRIGQVFAWIYGAYLFRTNADGTISTAHCVGSGTDNWNTSTTAINDGAWHHVAYVHDAPNKMLYTYIDGVSEGTPVDYTGKTLNTGGDPTSRMWIGDGFTNLSGLDGYADEYRVSSGIKYPDGTDFSASLPTAPFDRGTLAQVEIAYVDETGNLVLEDQGGAKATAPLSSGVNKCGIFKESGNIGVTVGGTTGTLVASTNDVGGNGNIQIGHGVTSPIELKNIKGYTGSLIQTQMETDTA